MNEIILPYASIKYIAPIVYCKYNDGIELGIPEIKELHSSIELLVGKKPYLIFSDAFCIGDITNEGKRMLRNYSNAPFCKGTAIFIDKERFESVKNFVKSYNLVYPFRVFSSG